MQNATGSVEYGLGRLIALQGGVPENEYRFRRIRELVIPNTRSLLQTFRDSKLSLVFLTYGSRRPDYSDLPPGLREFCELTNNRVGEVEYDIVADIAPLEGEVVINKRSVSPFTTTDFDAVLASLHAHVLVFCGVSTDVCVEHAVRDAADRGYACIVVSDACGATSPEDDEAGLRSMRNYGHVTETDCIVAGLASI